MGAYSSWGGYQYWDFWIYGDTLAERENALKLKLQEVRKDANAFHYKGVGSKIIDTKIDRRKDHIHLQVKLENTEQKKNLHKKKRKKR